MANSRETDSLPSLLGRATRFRTGIDNVVNTNQNLGKPEGPVRLNRFDQTISPLDRLTRIRQTGEIRRAIEVKTLPRLRKDLATIEGVISRMEEAIDTELVNIRALAEDGYITTEEITQAYDEARLLQRVNINRLHPRIERFLEGAGDKLGLLVRDFLACDPGISLCDAIKSFSTQSPEQQKEFDKQLAGIIFQSIGYLYLAQRYQQEGIFLFSPEEVFELYRRLYPGRRTIPHFGLSTGIKGVVIPDGFLFTVREERITLDAVIEYKAVRKAGPSRREAVQSREYTKRQLEETLFLSVSSGAATFGQISHNVHPAMPAKLIEIAPTLEIIYGIPSNSLFQPPRGRIERIPIDTFQLNQLIDVLKTALKEK